MPTTELYHNWNRRIRELRPDERITRVRNLAWLLVGIPLMGPLVAWFAFALVITVWIFFAILWLMGMVRALRGVQKPLAIVGGWAAKLPF